jgi:NAD+ synthetase
MPYRTSSPESLAHGQLVIDAPASRAHGGHLRSRSMATPARARADPARRGNVMARMRMITLFDLSAKYRAIPLGTGNKTERLFGYFTWHADDSPPINPLGDLFKTQVWALARTSACPR